YATAPASSSVVSRVCRSDASLTRSRAYRVRSTESGKRLAASEITPIPGTDAGFAPRRRSESSQLNDALILDAAMHAIEADGVDRLGMSAVARRAGLSTGALYGRYESGG